METDLSRVERFRQFKQEIRGNERYLIVGIDVAKDRLDVAVRPHRCRQIARSRSSFPPLYGSSLPTLA